MRKISMLLTMLVLAAMVLAACGGEETATNLPSTNVPPVTSEVTATEVSTATEMPTEVGVATETAGVPVTGELNPARLSNELDFTVQDQNGQQVGDVSDMVLDLDNTTVAYVVVATSDNRTILVPWNSLQLQTGTGGQQNAFVLQGNVDLSTAPEFDMTTLPQMGQPAANWDADVQSFWQNASTGTGTGTGQATATTSGTGAGTGTGSATATSSAGTGAGTGLATATTSAGTGAGTGLATATTSSGTGAGTGTGTSTGTGTGMGQLQGVVLASELLGSTVALGNQGTGTGAGVGLATATPSSGTGTGTGQATATAGTGTGGTGLATATTSAGSGSGTGSATATSSAGTGTGLATATSSAGSGTGTGTGTGSETATIDDAIIETQTGNIMYFVINTTMNGAETLIPVPLSAFRWDSGMQQFGLNVDAATLQSAPSFANGEYPDTTTSGWDSEFSTFWQSNGAGGTGTGTGTGTSSGGAGATATATP